jgi:hypothetical protein
LDLSNTVEDVIDLLIADHSLKTRTERGRRDGSEYDHWYGRHQNRVTQSWLVCRDCNRHLMDTDFEAGARSAFESYQQALRPFTGNRQMPLGLTT